MARKFRCINMLTWNICVIIESRIMSNIYQFLCSCIDSQWMKVPITRSCWVIVNLGFSIFITYDGVQATVIDVCVSSRISGIIVANNKPPVDNVL